MRNKIILLTFLAVVIVMAGYFLVAKFKTQNSNLVEVNNQQSPQKNDKGLPVLPKNMAEPIIDDTIRPDQDQLIAKHIAKFEEAFYSQDREQLYSQAEIIKKLGKDCIPQLLNIIANKEYSVLFRKMAFELIRDIGPSAAEADLFIGIMNDRTDDPLIRGEAAWTLGLTGSADAVDPLIEILSDKDEDARIRKLSATSLGLINDMRAENILIQIVNEHKNDNKVRSASAEALGYMHTSKGFNTLLTSLNDQSWEVQIASSKGLSSFGGDKAAQALGSQLLGYMQKESTDTNDAVVKSIIDSLSSIKSGESVPVLINVLKGKDQYRSALAGKALGEIGDKKALLPIEETLSSASDPFQVRLLTEAYKKLSAKQ